jgi:ribose/xylose/arabinose/galactoside ABC-type transport system permease subunit
MMPIDSKPAPALPVPSESRIQTLRRWFKRTGVSGQILTLAIVVLVFVAGTRGRFLSVPNLQAILSDFGIPALVAIGLHQAIILGAIDLSVEGIAGVCIVLVGLLVRNKYNPGDIGLWIIPVVLAAGALGGFANSLVITRLRIPSFISTLGMSWTLYGLAVFVNKATTIPLLDERIHDFVVGRIGGVPNIALLALAVAAGMQVLEDRTRFGRYLYAIGGDELLASQAGVRVDHMKVLVFTLAGAFYGLCALFIAAQLGSAHPRMGSNQLFPAVTAVAVGGVALTGGVGGAKNALLGALVVSALNNGLVLMHVNPFIQQAVNGVVLITAVAVTMDRSKLGFIK